jgi:hypothetical protein
MTDIARTRVLKAILAWLLIVISATAMVLISLPLIYEMWTGNKRAVNSFFIDTIGPTPTLTVELGGVAFELAVIAFGVAMLRSIRRRKA